MIGHSYKTAITVAVALIFILALVGSASAGNAVQLKIKGNGKLVDGARIFESDNDAVAERTLQVTLNGPGKLAFFDAGTVHAENTDGSIVADVNVTKIQVSGKSTGTGMVIANATVRAEGHNVLDENTGDVIGIEAESEIDSFINLAGGLKGSAEGKAFAAGTATATGTFTDQVGNDFSVETSAEGTTSASGKSTSPAKLIARGFIEGNALAGYNDEGRFIGIDPGSTIWSGVDSFGASTGSANAEGEANAIATDNNQDITVDTHVEGKTSVSGTGTKDAGFRAEAGIESGTGFFNDPYARAGADMWADVLLSGNTKSAKSSVSASATGEAETEVSFDDDLAPSFSAEIEEGSTTSSSASITGMGEAFGDTEIKGYVETYGEFIWGQPLPLDTPSAIVIDVRGQLVDHSLITSEAGAFGEGTGFKGSATAIAEGSAESEGLLSAEDDTVTNFSNSFAEGITKASASATGTGEAASGSAILSLDVIFGSGVIDLYGEPPEVEQIAPAQEDGQDILLEEFRLPYSAFAETSVIADFAYATGDSSKDTAKACSSASGETGASGAIGDIFQIDEASADSYATGAVNAAASVGAKADPFAASIIASTSIPGLNGDSLVDASLIAGIAESAGPKGTASASASGTTSANGTVEFVTNLTAVLDSHTIAAGITTVAATSADGFGLSVANIGSANYESFDDETTRIVTSADLVDVSLIGGVSTADGKASASSTATGFTTSDGMFIGKDTLEVEYVNITAHTEALSGGDTVATSVTSFGGYGVAAAGVGSVSTVDWVEGIPGNLEPAVPPAATVVDVSLIGDLVVADGFGPKDTVTAKASADGVTGATGNVLDTSFDDLVFNVTGNSLAAGEVFGKVVANQVSDPISVSTILSVNVVDVENTVDTGLGIPSDSTLVDVSTITSASLASGKNGLAQGSAEGFTDANGAVSMVDFMDNVTLISGTDALGMANTKATTTADGSLAISLAGQIAVDVIVNNEEPVAVGGFANPGITSFVLPEMPKLPVELPDEVNMLIGHGYEEFDRLGEAICTSGLLETDDKVCDEIGPFLQLLCDNKEAGGPAFAAAAESAGDPVVVGVSAAGSAVFSSGKGTASASTEGAAGTDGFVERVYGLNVNPEIESETFTGATSNADVRTFGGFGIGAAGAASVDVVTFEPDFTGGVPTATIVDVSVIGDAVFAAGATPKDTAKVTASADAFTEAHGSFETFVIGGIVDGFGVAIPVTDNSAESGTSAEGKVFGSAESARKSDPISASLIASVSVVDMDPVGAGDEDVFDTSIIASASFAADDYGKASGFAEGTTASSGDMSVEWIHDLITGNSVVANLSSDTNATGTAASNVAVQNGFGVAVSAFGSVNDIDYDPGIQAEVDDTSFMVNYAAGEGKQVTSSANSIKADTTSTGTLEVAANGVEGVDLDSETQVTGSGSATVQVSGGHQAEALSFMFADQEDFADMGGQTSNAITAFGVEVDGCNDAPVTSTAALSDGYLLADADVDNTAGTSSAHSEFTGIDAFAQLKSSQNIATIMVADSVPDLSYAPAGGADVDTYFLLADTNSQPNIVSYYREGVAVSDQANLFVPDLQILPILPF